MKTSTSDTIKGNIQEAKGKVKESAGRAANNPTLEAEGVSDRVGGKARQKVGQIKRVFGKQSIQKQRGKSFREFPPCLQSGANARCPLCLPGKWQIRGVHLAKR